MQISAYGDEIGRRFRIPPAPTLTTTLLKTSPVTFIRIKSDNPIAEPTLPHASEDAYAIQVLLRDLVRPELWRRGQSLEIDAAKKGSLFLFDLENCPSAVLRSPLDSVRFYITKIALKELARDLGVAGIDRLSAQSWGLFDQVLVDLASSLVPAFARPSEANTLFVDHVALAFFAHMLHFYGGVRCKRALERGGLSPWQLRRAKEMISANLAGSLSLEELASACGLSSSHFSKEFRRSTGLPPHRWLLKHRVERAQDMMLVSEMPLSEIAVVCGFSDQSHFNRVFCSVTGGAPGAWRKSRTSQAKYDLIASER